MKDRLIIEALADAYTSRVGATSFAVPVGLRAMPVSWKPSGERCIEGVVAFRALSRGGFFTAPVFSSAELHGAITRAAGVGELLEAMLAGKSLRVAMARPRQLMTPDPEGGDPMGRTFELLTPEGLRSRPIAA